MFTDPTKALYIAVANYIDSCGEKSVTRESINKRFPEVDVRRLSKALENACNRKLIHVIERGVYKSGQRPNEKSLCRRVHLSDEIYGEYPDTTGVVTLALRNRVPLESVWQGFCLSPPSQQAGSIS